MHGEAAAPGAVASRDSGPVRRRLIVFAARLSPDAWAMLAIVGVVVLANLPYVAGVFEPNPLGPRSGLVRAVALGPANGQPTIDPNTGFISQAVSHRAALDLVHLRLPWWNPYEATGAPLAGELQSAAFFPPTLFTLLSNGQLYEHILLEALAGIATFLLLRRLSINRWASLAGGAAFALNGTFAWFAHATVNPVAFLPLLLLGIELAYSAAAQRRRGGWWLIALAGALSFYAGFPEVVYIDGVLAVFWAAWRLGGIERAPLGGFVGKLAAGAVVGTLLSAPLLIAAIDYLNHGDVGAHGSAIFGSAHISPQQLPQLLMPYVYGPIFGFTQRDGQQIPFWFQVGGYLSASLVLFALVGLLGRTRRGLRLVLLAWIVLAFARMYGEPPLLGDLIGLLPGMPRVAFFRYADASLELSVIVLAALGLDDLMSVPDWRRRLLWASGAVLALVAAAAVGSRSVIDQLIPKFHHRPYFQAAVAWAVLVVLGAVAVAFVRRERLRQVLLTILVAGDVLVLFVAPELSAPRAVTVDTAPARYLQAHLGTGRFFTLGPIQPNYGSYFGIGQLNINDLPIPSVFEHYVRARLDQGVDPTLFVGNYGGNRAPFVPSPQQELIRNLGGYRAAGVTYVLAPRGQRLPAGTFKLVFRSSTTSIYRLSGSARYFSARGCQVEYDTRTATRVSCIAPSTLVRLETDMPGWSASVDGHSTPVRRTGGLFQAVKVPAGTHRVRFSFLPPQEVWGLVGLLVGLAWLVGGGVAWRRRMGVR